jgi:hypothetical protein
MTLQEGVGGKPNRIDQHLKGVVPYDFVVRYLEMGLPWKHWSWLCEFLHQQELLVHRSNLF